MLEAILYFFAVTALLLLCIFPAGSIVSRKLVSGSNRLHLACSFAFGVIGFSVAVVFLFLLGLDNFWIQIALCTWIVFFLTVSFKSSSLGFFRSGFETLLGSLIALVFALFCCLMLCFPTGAIEEARPDTSMYLTDLPVDLVIPYNVSRLMLEKLDPNFADIVPGWSAADRGPLAGILTAGIFYIIGVSDTTFWVNGSPGMFFVYQAILVLLNSSAIFIVWLLSAEWFNTRAASFSVLGLVTCYFVVINSFFAWPKFFMAALLLTSFWLLLDRKNYLLSGLIAGAGMLAHDSAIFSIAAFGSLLAFWEGYSFLKRRNQLIAAGIRLGSYVCGFVAAISPWLLSKALWVQASPRLFYMHLFCYHSENMEGISFSSLMSEYFQSHTWLDIVKIRAINVFYAFDLSPLYLYLEKSDYNLFRYLHLLSPYIFFQFFISLGFPILLIFLFVIYKFRREKAFKKLIFVNLACLLSVCFLSLISGCEKNTVNHIWSYPAFLSVMTMVGAGLSYLKGFWPLVFAVGVGINAFISIFYVYYRATIKPFLHASESYVLAVTSCFAFLLVLIALGGAGRSSSSYTGAGEK